MSVSVSLALPTCKGSPASEWDKVFGGRNFIKSSWHNCIGDHEEKNKYINGKHHSLRHVGEFRNGIASGYGKRTSWNYSTNAGHTTEAYWNNNSHQKSSAVHHSMKKVTDPEIKRKTALSFVFSQLSTKKRKSIQNKLIQLGLYKSDIDGLYGQGTSTALTAYNKRNFNGADLRVSRNVDKLFKSILAITSLNSTSSTSVVKVKTKTAAVTKICSSSTPEVCGSKDLCKKATITNNLKLEWDTYISAKPYLNEAKKRGLTCGVKVQTTTPKVAPTPTPKVVEVPKTITKSEAELFKQIKEEFDLSYYGGFIHSERLPNTLFFFSKIEKNDSFEFRKALRVHDIELVVLSSPGGSVFEGLQTAGIIHDKNLKTYIPKKSLYGSGNCSSACSFMFFAGETRSAEGDLGVHQFYSGKASDEEKIGATQKLAQFTVSEIIGFLNEFETPPWVFERMFQQKEMYYFKESELLQLETEVSEETKALHERAEKFIYDFRSAFVKIKD